MPGRRPHRVALRAMAVLWMTALIGAAARPAPRPSGDRDAAPASAPAWAEWVEPDFPFFSSVIDARRAGDGFPGANLTPRGVVMRIGPGQWAGFDVDLLRVAAVWRGRGVTPVALAPGSYTRPDRKTPGGQSPLPQPDGEVLVANGIYAGWQSGPRVSLTDPREPAPSIEEVGRGPLPAAMGRFTAIRQVAEGGVVLEYSAAGAAIEEQMTASEEAGAWSLSRRLRVGPSARPLWLVLGIPAAGVNVTIARNSPVLLETAASTDDPAAPPVRVVRVPAHGAPVAFTVVFSRGATPAAGLSPSAPGAVPKRVPDGSGTPATSLPSRPSGARWPQEVVTNVTRSTATDPYVVDDVPLPLENPWRRNVRISDIQFLHDGTGVGITIDGDVWLIRGLDDPSGRVRWRRYASGLHEPLTLAVRDDEIFAFDRNGIWRLRDTNGDGEADRHELFSNAFAQTADMREFPSGIRLAPGGEFIIAKGGQEALTQGKHNGSVLRVSADGRRATVLGYGFRQPNIGVNLRTGLVTATDQQGNYVPSTPLHIVRDGQFYGFLGDKRPREVYPAPIAEPLTWVPHAANASAMSQIWLFGARLGPLNDALVYLGFNNPELFRVLLDDREPAPQAAVVSVTRAFDFPPLHGSVNPSDGQLYVAGFQVLGWGTTATRLAGLGRVRWTGAPSTLPRELIATDRGLLMRFDQALDAGRAMNPDSYALASWSYRRTYQYGSPQFRADGSVGMDRLVPSAAYLSKDGRSVFIAVPGMKPVMQMRLGWSLAIAGGPAFQDTAYFTPHDLRPFVPEAEGFGALTVDLAPRVAAADPAAPVSAEEGRKLYQAYGCIACHAIDAASLTRLGPSWKGLYGSERSFAAGVVKGRADEAYLRESILQPAARVVTGYDRGDVSMPSYAGVLSEAQVESLIAFIRTLR